MIYLTYEYFINEIYRTVTGLFAGVRRECSIPDSPRGDGADTRKYPIKIKRMEKSDSLAYLVLE